MTAPSLGLIGDIGGTNARFALVDERGAIGQALTLPTDAYPGPLEAIQAYLLNCDQPCPAQAALALACPVASDAISFTNNHWAFSLQALKAALGLFSLRAFNDFTAQALAIPKLTVADWFAIGGGEATPDAPIAVIGPGTGLGVSALVPSSDGWQPLATEGGHVTLAAMTDREAQVIAYLRADGHVSAERLISGGGLVTCYRALAALEGKPAPEVLKPASVAEAALAGKDPLAAEALSLFFDFLGTVSADLTLSIGARGGVYLAGGILPRMAKAFQASGFRTRFETKGRFSDYLAQIPTRLITHPDPAFLGLAGEVNK